MDATGAVEELPFPKAQRLRQQGLTDSAIEAELMRSGLTAEDARFVIQGLPGGSLGHNVALEASAAPGASAGSRLPISGILILVVGILITAGSYLTAAPGGTYVVTWGLILVGIIRILRGK